MERRIRDAIRDVRINHLEDIRKGKSAKVKAKMKKDLDKQLDICISTVLAIYPLFSLKERREIIELCHRIRSANLFNHYLVSFPLMNYSDNVGDDINLSNMTLSSLKEKYFCIKPDSRKIELSPRFIYFEEFAQYSFIRNIVVGESGIPKTSAEDIDRIWNTFIRANQIDSRWARSLSITFKEEKEPIEGYFLNRIVLLDKYRSLSKIRIAVASIKLDIEECCMGLNDTPVIRNRMDFISFLSASYNGRDDKVDYLVFPEFYLPISWIQDVLSFVRKTGVTVISGLQYICRNEIAKNTIGVFARVKSGKYNSAFLFAREKNDYAPLEKKLLATEGYLVKDQDAPHYTLFDDGMVKFGIFLCYEFTDICARGLFKDKADILFIPENSNDTSYFSNIIEATTRDIHAFMVQANTSIYGDSRISGPYDRDHRNVVQIKGGDTDNIIIGTINIQAIKDHRKKECRDSEKEIRSTLDASEEKRKDIREKLMERHNLKIERVSARTKY